MSEHGFKKGDHVKCTAPFPKWKAADDIVVTKTENVAYIEAHSDTVGCRGLFYPHELRHASFTQADLDAAFDRGFRAGEKDAWNRVQTAIQLTKRNFGID